MDFFLFISISVFFFNQGLSSNSIEQNNNNNNKLSLADRSREIIKMNINKWLFFNSKRRKSFVSFVTNQHKTDSFIQLTSL